MVLNYIDTVEREPKFAVDSVAEFFCVAARAGILSFFSTDGHSSDNAPETENPGRPARG
jgi:hypothetical protein